MITKIHLRNVKGVTGSFDLGKITNIIGANGSGKSAILEGLKIGLTGYTDLGKLAGKTFQLSSDKAMEISIEADNQTLSRKFERSGAGAKQTITLNGEAVSEKDLVIPTCFSYPVESIHPSEFLNLSDEKRADFVFSAMGPEINSISPKDFSEKLSFCTGNTGFSELLETFKTKKSELEKEIKRCLANLQKLTGELGEMPAGNLNEWEERKATAAVELEKVVSEIATNEERVKLASSKNEQIARIQKNISDSSEKIANSEKKILDLQSAIVPVVNPAKSKPFLDLEKIKLTKQLSVAETAKEDLESKLQILNEKGCCPFCNALACALESSMDEWELKVFNFATEIEETGLQLKVVEEGLTVALQAEKANEANAFKEREIKVENDALKSYRKFNTENMEALAKLNVDSDQAPVSVEILQGKVEGLRVQVKEADENIKKFVSVQGVRNKKSESEEERIKLETELEKVKSMLEEVKEIRNKRLSNASAKLAEPFQKIVSAAFGCEAFISLTGNNDKPCFEFGIVSDRHRDEKYKIGFDTLSGGEKTIMLTALVACIQIVKNGKPGIGLFELAEADDKSVDALVKAVEAVGFDQVVIASCHGKPLSDAVNICMINGMEAPF